MDILYIVMPAYNEETNIENVVNQWMQVGVNKMIIADSGSTDSTHEKLLNLQKTYPQLVILSNTEKQHGPKLMALYDYSIKNGADYIFQTDSDGQTNPQEFAAFWSLRNNYDIILGHRYKRDDGKIRAFVEGVVCFLVRIYFHVNIPDANAPFRLMKSEIIEKYLHRLPPDYNLPNIMLTVYFTYYKENITFRKITFKARQSGVNSINISKIITIGWNALFDFAAFKKGMVR
ncbi:MAG: glycosyltransferase family 2 protein [Hungatella sp.]|nr:glycosyltransferase family 2 protein [Hungatella sp.]